MVHAATASWVIGVLACGPTPGADDTAGSGSTTTLSIDASSGSTAGATGTSTSSDESTQGGSTLDTGDTDATSDTGEPACPEPEPEPVVADFTVSPDQDISATCTVLAQASMGDTSVLDLDCAGEAITVSMSASPMSSAPSTSVGATVHLEYITELVFWINRWIALHDDSDRLIFGGISSSSFDPPDTTLSTMFGGADGDPLMAEVSGVCEPFEDRCGLVERVAIELTAAFDGYTMQAFDQGTAYLNVLAFGYRMLAQSAVRHPRPQGCDDLPPVWYQVVVFWFPSE